MDIKELLTYVDHTLLSPAATGPDYIRHCCEGIKHGVAAVCVPPSRVGLCADYLDGRVKICTVAGFPNGYSDTRTKVLEATTAIGQGACEIDMVIDIGLAKEQNFGFVLEDIKAMRSATAGSILKVIIETTLLTQDEKIALCHIVSESGADYIKTSTGFAGGGATDADVALLRKYSAPHVKVKAAGGISSLEDAFRFIALGADRLGTSRLIKLAQGLDGTGY